MEKLKIILWDKAEKDLEKLLRRDKISANKVIKELENFANNPKGNFNIKLLKGKFENLYRLRVGNYRIIYDIINDEINVYRVRHRKEVYLWKLK